jgi:hypothetical protein
LHFGRPPTRHITHNLFATLSLFWDFRVAKVARMPSRVSRITNRKDDDRPLQTWPSLPPSHRTRSPSCSSKAIMLSRARTSLLNSVGPAEEFGPRLLERVADCDACANTDTSQWPLLLKNYDKLLVRSSHFTPIPTVSRGKARCERGLERI